MRGVVIRTLLLTAHSRLIEAKSVNFSHDLIIKTKDKSMFSVPG